MMINFNEALTIIDTNINCLQTEVVALRDSLNRVLAEDVYSDLDMPPFNKSAMDGFACDFNDINNNLEVIATIAAGTNSNIIIGKNQCVKIMTGAIVPDSANCVIMKEDIELIDNKYIKVIKQSSKRNICYKGEDIKNGNKILTKGIKIKSQHIAILASAGKTNPLVYKNPSIAVISTGDELVEPEVFPKLSQIRNSNGWQMTSQIISCGLNADYKGIANDDLNNIITKVELSLKNNNLVLLSGGVSVGDYDFVPEAIKTLGFKVLFHGINMKPGKRILVAKKDDKYIVGMPGNPVSSLIQFELIVKAMIRKFTGMNVFEKAVSVKLLSDYNRKKGEKMELVPVKLYDQGVDIVNYNGSAHIHAYSIADGFMQIPENITQIKKGDSVYVRFL